MLTGPMPFSTNFFDFDGRLHLVRSSMSSHHSNRFVDGLLIDLVLLPEGLLHFKFQLI
ncbi:hypothetical protein MKZ08_16365 [Viridibacillus sp. FSL R5-0477]|uniref:hypothetical protein n=1 Tax=Viridibacillus TaxID=496496 RepID=UPI0012DBFEB2|nr:hypothetical protein [Viridibacillus arenosi]